MSHHGPNLSCRVGNAIHRKAKLVPLVSGGLVELVAVLLLDLIGLPGLDGQDIGDVLVGDRGISGHQFGDKWAAAEDSVGGPAADFDNAP